MNLWRTGLRLNAVLPFRCFSTGKKNYYDVLGISKTANSQEIKEAFYSLSKKYHPDVVGTDSKQFLEVKEAYDALKDDEKRQVYDHQLEYDFSSPTFGESLKHRRRSYEFRPGDPIDEAPRNVHYESIDLSSRYGHFYDPNQEILTEKRNRKMTIIGICVFIGVIALNIMYIHYLFNKQNRVEH